MALPAGEVTTIEKVGSFRLPEESSAWLAYYKGVGGPAAAGAAAQADVAAAAGAARRRRRRRHGAGGRERGQEGQGAGGTPREKRKDPGSDLILRNLATGEEITIPEVTEYDWDKKGTWLAYAVSSTRRREGRRVRAPA